MFDSKKRYVDDGAFRYTVDVLQRCLDNGMPRRRRSWSAWRNRRSFVCRACAQPTPSRRLPLCLSLRAVVLEQSQQALQVLMPEDHGMLHVLGIAQDEREMRGPLRHAGL